MERFIHDNGITRPLHRKTHRHLGREKNVFIITSGRCGKHQMKPVSIADMDHVDVSFGLLEKGESFSDLRINRSARAHSGAS
jgi:hypothetical protein